MTHRLTRAAGASFPLLLALGCSDAPGSRLEIGVSPLTLPGISDACYSVAVYDGDPDVDGALVWSQDALCASRYGNGAGGDISYVGTCSAQPDGRINHVQLAIEDLYRVGDGPTGTTLDADLWQNPCPVGTPCELAAPCRENADVPVEFNLVVMRNAEQGFFDVAVNFEDVFCSAKLDCVDALLHRANGDRDDTAVIGFACTSGGDTTHLYLSDIVITCDGDEVVRIDPEAGPGQLGSQGVGAFQAAVYQGLQAFQAEQHCYWNSAVGLDLAALSGDCTLTLRGTASEDALEGSDGAWLTPANTVYPVIDWAVPLTVGGVRVCGANALNGDGSGVQTGYTGIGGAALANHYACGGDDTPPVNQAPQVSAPIGAIGLAEGDDRSIVLADHVFDPEGAALTFSLDTGAGFITLDGDVIRIRTSTWGDTYNTAGTYPLTVHAYDDLGAETILGATVVIGDTNRKPVQTSVIGSLDLPEDSYSDLDVSNYVSDPDGDALTYTPVGAPPYISMTGSRLEWNQPPEAYVGPYEFLVSVDDGLHGADPLFVTISGNINNSNDGPSAGNPNPYSFSRGLNAQPATFYYYMEGFWVDAESDTFTIEWFDLPSWLQPSNPDTFAPEEGSLWLIGNASSTGTYTFYGIPTDSQGAVGQVHTFILTVF